MTRPDPALLVACRQRVNAAIIRAAGKRSKFRFGSYYMQWEVYTKVHDWQTMYELYLISVKNNLDSHVRELTERGALKP